MLILEVMIYLLIGLFAGFLAGLLGIGGGIVTVPLLILVFKVIGIPKEILMQLAIGTSLAAMLVNTFFSFISHQRKGRVIWSLIKFIIPGTIIGSYFGAIIAKALTGEALKEIFGGFECLIAVWFLLTKEHSDRTEEQLKFPFWCLSGMGVGIGTIATMMGISGGQITLPLLSQMKLSLTKAIGTSAAISFFVSITGTLAYTIPNLGIHYFRDSVGFIYLPAFVPISLACFFIAPRAALLSGKLSTNILRRVFSGVLFLTGLSLMIF